jgi:hypothetical protein
MEGLAIGRIVHYSIHESDLKPDQKKHAGEVIAAIIVAVVDDDSMVNLTCFPDWSNNGFFTYNQATPQPLGMFWKTSVKHSQDPEPGKWSWPPRK